MSIERDLQEECVGHLDLSGYARVATGTLVSEVLNVMRRQRVSAVLVEDEADKLAGIFTERDVLNKVVDDAASWALPIDGFMTSGPETLAKDEPVSHALRMMNSGHYRDVPIVDEDGGVVGNLTLYAIIRFLTDRFPTEIYNLPPDPELIARTREGA